jgi:hypothetical protein
MRFLFASLVASTLAACAGGERAQEGHGAAHPEFSISEPGVSKGAFDDCPGANASAQAADVSWAPQASRLAEHRALRERLNKLIPEGASRILFWSSGRHHTLVSFSVIAVRDAHGRWRTSGVGEEGPGLSPIEPTPMPPLERELSQEEGRALDQVLADPCLYASPTFRLGPNIVAGGAVQTIEVEMGTRRWISSWFGARTPQQETVVSLIAR